MNKSLVIVLIFLVIPIQALAMDAERKQSVQHGQLQFELEKESKQRANYAQAAIRKEIRKKEIEQSLSEKIYAKPIISVIGDYADEGWENCHELMPALVPHCRTVYRSKSFFAVGEYSAADGLNNFKVCGSNNLDKKNFEIRYECDFLQDSPADRQDIPFTPSLNFDAFEFSGSIINGKVYFYCETGLGCCSQSEYANVIALLDQCTPKQIGLIRSLWQKRATALTRLEPNEIALNKSDSKVYRSLPQQIRKNLISNYSFTVMKSKKEIVEEAREKAEEAACNRKLLVAAFVTTTCAVAIDLYGGLLWN